MLCLFPYVYVVHLSQVLVSNSLAALSGSSSERSYCDNLNISVCPITESSKKVEKKKNFNPTQTDRRALTVHISVLIIIIFLSVLSQRVQPSGPARHLARQAACKRECVRHL